jgi:hypothetical protein
MQREQTAQVHEAMMHFKMMFGEDSSYIVGALAPTNHKLFLLDTILDLEAARQCRLYKSYRFGWGCHVASRGVRSQAASLAL